MKRLISILLRAGILLLGFSLSFLGITLLQSIGVILPQPSPWKFILIIGTTGAILIILGVLLYKGSDRNRPRNQGAQSEPDNIKAKRLPNTWTEGQQFSGRELSTMLIEAGFAEIEVKPTFDYWSIVTGHKPS